MKRLIFFFTLSGFLIACDKDSLETKPAIEVESLSSDVVARNQNLTTVLSFTDKEGDISDTLYVVRTRTNRRGMITLPALDFKVPEFPAKTKGEVTVNLAYSILTLQLSPLAIPGNSSQNEPDTLILKFVLKDKQKNISDTAKANVIVQRS